MIQKQHINSLISNTQPSEAILYENNCYLMFGDVVLRSPVMSYYINDWRVSDRERIRVTHLWARLEPNTPTHVRLLVDVDGLIHELDLYTDSVTDLDQIAKTRPSDTHAVSGVYLPQSRDYTRPLCEQNIW